MALQKVVNARGVISGRHICQMHFAHVLTCKTPPLTHPVAVPGVRPFPTPGFCLLSLPYVVLTLTAKMDWLFFGAMKTVA